MGVQTRDKLAWFAGKLNAEAIALQDADREAAEPMGCVTALRTVAKANGLTMVNESDQCEIYVGNGFRLNLWIEAPGEGVGEGGLGFDDQTEWADD